jgi:hypothetical protein
MTTKFKMSTENLRKEAYKIELVCFEPKFNQKFLGFDIEELKIMLCKSK